MEMNLDSKAEEENELKTEEEEEEDIKVDRRTLRKKQNVGEITSIRLPKEMVQQLKVIAKKNGWDSYQEMAREIFMSLVEDDWDFVTRKSVVKRLKKVAEKKGWDSYQELNREIVLIALREELVPVKVS